MYADLHVHTYFSDSTRSPEELAEAAAARGIGLIAACDHDTVEAHSRLRPACAAHGLRITAGSDDHGEFNRFIDGVEYALGQIMVDESQLDLRGLI